MQYKDQYRSLTPEQQTGANALFKQYTSIPGSDVTSAAQKALSTYITSPVTTQPTEAAKTTTG